MLSICSINGQELIEFTGAKINTNEKKQYIEASLFFKIQNGYHIQSVAAAEYGFIPTAVSLENNGSLEVFATEIIAKNNAKANNRSKIKNVLKGIFEVRVKIRTSNPDIFLKGKLNYQACSDRQCLFPRTLGFQFKENLNNYKSSK